MVGGMHLLNDPCKAESRLHKSRNATPKSKIQTLATGLMEKSHRLIPRKVKSPQCGIMTEKDL